MSGKYAAKQTNKKKNGKGRGKIVALILALIALCAAVVFLIAYEPDQTAELPEASDQADQTVSADAPGEIGNDASQEVHFALDYGLEITKVGAYTGAYMEDGSDEVVSDVLMIMVTNNGDAYIQYAEITLTGDSGSASFSLSTLYPGDSVVLLETNRLSASAGVYTAAEAGRVAVFSEIPSLCSEKLEIQALNGVINVTNISGEDIADDIVIYYKNCIDGLYYGGITYRIRISGGMENGEIKQLMSDHFTASASEIMFVTCG